MTFEADVFCTIGQIHNKSIVIIGGKSNVGPLWIEFLRKPLLLLCSALSAISMQMHGRTQYVRPKWTKASPQCAGEQYDLQYF